MKINIILTRKTKTELTYILRDFHNFPIISAHNPFFQARDHLEQFLEYAMLAPLSNEFYL